MKIKNFKLKSAIAFLCLLSFSPSSTAMVVTQEKGIRKRPTRPSLRGGGKRGVPPGRGRRPGGTLSGDQAACTKTKTPVTALIPLDVVGQTAEDYPVFWFYLPQAPQSIERGEFSVLSSQIGTELYKTHFTLPEAPGLVSISLPRQPATALKVGETYRWNFKLYCQGNQTHRSDIRTSGKIERIPASRNQTAATTSVVWFDTFNKVAIALQNQPITQDRSTFKELLNSIELPELGTAPIIGPVLIESISEEVLEEAKI